MKYTTKRFTVATASGAADPDDYAARWEATFGKGRSSVASENAADRRAAMAELTRLSEEMGGYDFEDRRTCSDAKADPGSAYECTPECLNEAGCGCKSRIHWSETPHERDCDLWTCPICDGGPGNDCACWCGFEG